MMVAILFSLKSVKSLENRLQPHSGATPLFSMRTESQALSSIDADAWCKWALTRRRAHHTHTHTHTQRTHLPRVPPRRDAARVRTRRVSSAELTSCGMSRAPCVCGPPRRAARGGSAPAAASGASSSPSQTFSVAK